MTRAERDEYKAWLASLKEGDEVAIQCMPGGKPGGKPAIAVVKFRCGDGRILVYRDRSQITFKPNGRVGELAFRGPMMLLKVDQELRTMTDAERAKTRLSRLNWFTESDAKALRIVAILDEPES